MRRVIAKLFIRHPLHAKLYLLFRDDKISPIIGYLGSSNLTLAGLLHQGELNVDVLVQDAALKLTKWFEDRWNDRWCIDISKELVEIIDNSWAADRLVSPYHIYLKIAYHLSREARAGLAEFKIPKILQEKLHSFQQKAVSIAAHYLNKRDGVLIGDVVGFGKTLTATALAKIFEEDFFLETLIICPKNLTNMWEDYAHTYQLRAKVLPITQVQSVLPKLRRYRLIIIDESHNLRNREGKRYRAIQEYIQINESKVIMLPATPYNKTYLDLSNQLRLFIQEDKDLGISPEKFIESIGGRVQFMAKYQYSATTLSAFEKSSYADDWRELMRLYMVRRPRSFIKQNYAETDPVNGRKYLLFSDGSRSYFPDRVPKKAEYDFNPNDPKDKYAGLYSDAVVDTINSLNLPRYGLGNYLDKKTSLKPTKEETVIQDNLSHAGRRLMGFCRTNLFKRLESSGYAFLVSLSRHILRNYIYVYALENNLPLPIGTQEANMLDEFLGDVDLDNTGTDEGTMKILLDEEDYYAQAKKIYKLYETKYHNRFDWIRSGFFENTLKNILIYDSKEILKILKIGKDWNPADDRQLNALYDLCTEKHPKEKILIFTQFADTAYYLRDELKKRSISQIECVTGDSEDPTTCAYRFSPISNDKKEFANTPDEIRVLITTDVLSEGQNLQDGHIIVNYDLPWAIILLIQRAGRVDRIGQKSDKILCYSFLPEEGIEKIIKLRGRLGKRIKENAEVVGSDEVFFDGDPVKIHDFYNEKQGILDEEDDIEVDLASYAYQIWKNATDADPTLKKTIPDMPHVIYATKSLKPEDEKKDDYTRTADDNDVLIWVDRKGEIITQSQLVILKAAECSPDTPPLFKLDNHHKLVEKGIEHIIQVESTIGGQLGKKSSARYRTYMRLNRHYEEYKGTLFVNEAMKRAIDDIYKFPLKEFARETLNRQLKAGISDEDLANLVVSLRDEDKLCNTKEEEKTYKEPQIIGSELYHLEAVAEKKGIVVFACLPDNTDKMPDYHIRKKIDSAITKLYFEHLIIFCDLSQKHQIWQLVIREQVKPLAVRETHYYVHQEPELLFQKLKGLFFSIDDEEKISIVDVKSLIQEQFNTNAEKVTRRFYDQFKKEHTSFLNFIKGISENVDKDWYASLMLNRLMSIYFIQKKGFLDNDKDYLKNRLKATQEKRGKNRFYSFYRNFLLVLFHKGLGSSERNPELISEIGIVPYLNGGLFDVHHIEQNYDNIGIADEAFEQVFRSLTSMNGTWTHALPPQGRT